jgi:hypothetical protein
VYEHPLTRRALLLGAAAGVAALAEGCSANRPAHRQSRPPRRRRCQRVRNDHTNPGSDTQSPSPRRKPPDPAKVKANELGTVPVMMYHRLTSKPGEYDMTPAAFRAQVRTVAALRLPPDRRA